MDKIKPIKMKCPCGSDEFHIWTWPDGEIERSECCKCRYRTTWFEKDE